MEYCRGGDLFDRIIQTKDISEAKIAGIMQQVLSALSFLHSNNFSHRDIKAENILFLNED